MNPTRPSRAIPKADSTASGSQINVIGQRIARRYRIGKPLQILPVGVAYQALDEREGSPVTLLISTAGLIGDPQPKASCHPPDANHGDQAESACDPLPGTVRVYDDLVTDHGGLRLRVRRVDHADGGTLAVPATSRLDPSRCLGVLLMVALILRRWHRAGVVHGALASHAVWIVGDRVKICPPQWCSPRDGSKDPEVDLAAFASITKQFIPVSSDARPLNTPSRPIDLNESFVRRCARDATDRFRDTDELITALRRLRRGIVCTHETEDGEPRWAIVTAAVLAGDWEQAKAILSSGDRLERLGSCADEAHPGEQALQRLVTARQQRALTILQSIEGQTDAESLALMGEAVAACPNDAKVTQHANHAIRDTDRRLRRLRATLDLWRVGRWEDALSMLSGGNTHDRPEDPSEQLVLRSMARSLASRTRRRQRITKAIDDRQVALGLELTHRTPSAPEPGDAS